MNAVYASSYFNHFKYPHPLCNSHCTYVVRIAREETTNTLGRASIKSQDLPINPLTLLTSQEAYRLRNIIRKPISGQRRSMCSHLSFISLTGLPRQISSQLTYLLPCFGGVSLATRDVVLRDVMEHVRNCATRSNGIDRDLLVPTVLGHDADERLDGTLRAGIQ